MHPFRLPRCLLRQVSESCYCNKITMNWKHHFLNYLKLTNHERQFRQRFHKNIQDRMVQDKKNTGFLAYLFVSFFSVYFWSVSKFLGDKQLPGEPWIEYIKQANNVMSFFLPHFCILMVSFATQIEYKKSWMETDLFTTCYKAQRIFWKVCHDTQSYSIKYDRCIFCNLRYRNADSSDQTFSKLCNYSLFN